MNMLLDTIQVETADAECDTLIEALEFALKLLILTDR